MLKLMMWWAPFTYTKANNAYCFLQYDVGVNSFMQLLTSH